MNSLINFLKRNKNKMHFLQQVYLTVARPNIQIIIDRYEKDGYDLIQKADLTSKKVLLTFQRVMKANEN